MDELFRTDKISISDWSLDLLHEAHQYHAVFWREASYGRNWETYHSWRFGQ